MGIYLGLIGFVLALSVVAFYWFRDPQQQQRFVLRLGMLAIFLLLALKKETVGIDIPGYRQQYLLSASIPWENVTYVYYEPGYILLMKLFSKAGFPFQIFTGCIYGLCCHGYYQLIKKYSPNAALSLLVFICYQFLVFYTSGLRQALAMGICIYAFLLLDAKRGTLWVRFFGAVLLVMAAAAIHKSALLFLGVLVLAICKPRKLHWFLGMVGLLLSPVVRPLLLRWIDAWIGSVQLDSQITLGGNFVFLTGMTLLSGFACYGKRPGLSTNQAGFLPLCANILLLSVIVQVLFSGSPLLRSAMYLTMFLIPGLPCALKRLESRLEVWLTWCLEVFLIALFCMDTLWVNQLKLQPYRFFWQ